MLLLTAIFSTGLISNSFASGQKDDLHESTDPGCHCDFSNLTSNDEILTQCVDTLKKTNKYTDLNTFLSHVRNSGGKYISLEALQKVFSDQYTGTDIARSEALIKFKNTVAGIFYGVSDAIEKGWDCGCKTNSGETGKEPKVNCGKIMLSQDVTFKLGDKDFTYEILKGTADEFFTWMGGFKDIQLGGADVKIGGFEPKEGFHAETLISIYNDILKDKLNSTNIQKSFEGILSYIGRTLHDNMLYGSTKFDTEYFEKEITEGFVDDAVKLDDTKSDSAGGCEVDKPDNFKIVAHALCSKDYYNGDVKTRFESFFKDMNSLGLFKLKAQVDSKIESELKPYKMAFVKTYAEDIIKKINEEVKYLHENKILNDNPEVYKIVESLYGMKDIITTESYTYWLNPTEAASNEFTEVVDDKEKTIKLPHGLNNFEGNPLVFDVSKGEFKFGKNPAITWDSTGWNEFGKTGTGGQGTDKIYSSYIEQTPQGALVKYLTLVGELAKDLSDDKSETVNFSDTKDKVLANIQCFMDNFTRALQALELRALDDNNTGNAVTYNKLFTKRDSDYNRDMMHIFSDNFIDQNIYG